MLTQERVTPTLDSRRPAGPLETQWETYKQSCRLVSPANKRKYTVLVVGTGLAGASAAATLAELGYQVLSFCIQDSPRRAHSIAAQGGINAAKNYQNDGDSVWRLFADTLKGGDFRARESNVYRLAQLSTQIIDHCVAQGVPFAREYGGTLANRSFGGVLVSRTFYAQGQTGQQLLLGAYGSLMRQVNLGRVKLLPRREMLDLVVADGVAQGIVVRNLVTGALERYAGDAVVLATGGYGNAYFLSTNARNSNATAAWRCYKRGALMANPCYVQIHPTCIPVSGDYQSKLTLMSESLRNDGRVWVPRQPGDKRRPAAIPEAERDYFLEEEYPTYGNLVPRDVASRSMKRKCDAGYGVGATGRAVYLDFSEALQRLGRETVAARYGNLFDIYAQITGDDPYQTPMRIYPAVHYVMGGLWVDYGLMSMIPGLFVLGEANFSDHGANRLGASALMQGLADGYFVLPYTLGDYLAGRPAAALTTDRAEFAAAEQGIVAQTEHLLGVGGRRSPLSFHRELGLLLWDTVGMGRTAAGLQKALSQLQHLKTEFWQDVRVGGTGQELNKNLEAAGRVADFLELGELMALDALAREESCGAHFREEHQTAEGEPLRNDQDFAHVAAWAYAGAGRPPVRHQEPLVFTRLQPSQRSYR